MRPLTAMIKANLKMSFRNRQALFWNLAFPAIFILIFGAVFGPGNTFTFSVGISGDPSPFAAASTTALKDNSAITVKEGTTDKELAALKDGDRDIVLVFGPQESGSTVPTVNLYYDQTEGPNAAISVNVVRQILLSVAQGSDPLPITEKPISAQSVSFIDYFVPGILAMALMNSGVIGLSTAFVIYRERGILRRIKVTPFPLTSFIFARVASQLIVAVAQAVILVGMAMAIFGMNLNGNPLTMLVVIILGALAFLSVGFALSGIARNAETAASYANLITFPMLFLSGVFFSLDSAPAWLTPITKVLPLKYLVDALRKTMTRSASIGDLWLDLSVLLVTFAVGMMIAVRFFRWDSRAA